LEAIHVGGRNLVSGTSLDKIYSGAAPSGSYKDVWSGLTINEANEEEYIVSFEAKGD
jgi:hypothetical protein